jgi:acetyl-CoA acyltransferase
LRDAFILAAVRTPIGRYRGTLASVRADDLAAAALGGLMQRAGLTSAAQRGQVQEIFLGCANQGGEDNRNVARMAALLADFPHEVPAATVNRLCGSGLEAVAQAARLVRSGEAELVIAGGVEQMTRAPWVMGKPEAAFEGPGPMYDSSLGWRFPNPKLAERFPLEAMGETAENVAERYQIRRESQDAFALRSHQLAVAAQAAGRFQGELWPLEVAQKKGPAVRFERDEGPRADTSLEKLAALKPVFRKGGTVTAGNASPLNDGAAALLIADEATAKRLGLPLLARVVATSSAGVDPRFMGLGPIPATRKALARAGWTAGDLDLVELNEAFAAQALACAGELELNADKVNVNGGAIALGHPLGASGARILTTLVHEMKRRGARKGLAAMCIGVGQGVAALLESA